MTILEGQAAGVGSQSWGLVAAGSSKTVSPHSLFGLDAAPTLSASQCLDEHRKKHRAVALSS